MTRIPVERITFDFDDTWIADRWDDTPAYRSHISRLTGELEGRPHGTKAVDVFGIREDLPYLFEVKDFRGYAIENRPRDFGELPLEIGLKARDTVAGLAGLVSRGNPPDLVARWVRLVAKGKQVRVVAWVAEGGPRHGESISERKARQSVRGNLLGQRVAWLTAKCLVADPLVDTAVPGVTAQPE